MAGSVHDPVKTSRHITVREHMAYLDNFGLAFHSLFNMVPGDDLWSPTFAWAS